MLRLVLQGVLTFFSLLLLVFVLAKSSGEIAGAWILLALFVFLILLLGPLWLRSKKQKQQTIRPSTEILKIIGPISGYPTLLGLMAMLFYYFAWETYYYPHASYKKIFAIAYGTYGNMGVVTLNALIGTALLASAVLVYRYLKSVYKHLDGP